MLLRDYQSDALAAVSNLVQRGARRLVVAMATGAGKTIVFSNLADALGLKPTDKILILAHRDELVQQAVDKYLQVNPGEIIGVEKAKAKAGPMDRVCVASVQTLQGARVQDFLARFGTPALIVTDECHHAPSVSYRSIYDACGVSAHGDIVHVGVTATPKRADKVGLDGVYDVVAYSIGIADLVKRGYLVPLAGYRVQTKTNLDAVRVVAGEFNQGDLADAVDNPERNARVVQAYTDITPGRKALVFAASVAHSKNLCDTFKLAGYRAAHVDGETPLIDRRAIFAAFAKGVYDVLCNCSVATEGYDEPSLEVVMIARPTKSTVLYAQMLGRGTRLHPGKTKAAIIDMVDASRKHSVVTLPSLLGLPPNFNLGGRNATALAERWQELVDRDPDLAPMLNDAAAVAQMEMLGDDERRGAMIRRLLEQAKATSTYVPVDLFRPAPLPAEIDEFARMTWVPLGDDRYRLAMRDATIMIEGDVVGDFRVSVRHQKSGTQTDLGTHKGYRDAFTAAEAWVRQGRGEQLVFLDRRAHWRNMRATAEQMRFLRRQRVDVPDNLTRGAASDMMDMLIKSLAAKKEPTRAAHRRAQ